MGKGKSFEMLHRTSRRSALHTYYALEKRLADSGAFDLLWHCAEAFAHNQSPFYSHISGWAFTEAALISAGEPLEGRYELLRLAAEEWETAYQLQANKDNLERGGIYNESLHSPELIRIEISQATSEVFKAMVNGDITPHIRHDYYQKLLHTAMYACNGVTENTEFTRDEGTIYMGLAHEINAMLVINRLQSPTLMAFPALPRADSGINFPRQTHDITLHNMKWGVIKNSLPIEVKTTPRESHFNRYDAVIIGGTMHLHPDYKRDPSYLTELLVKEFTGTIADDELAVLNAITDRVLHTARHGYSNIPQCRDVTNCHAVPRTRHEHAVTLQ